MEEYQSFWWVNDDQLRETIEHDYTEAQKCSANRIDKATMVLCGSVIEGLLFDATREYWTSNEDVYLAEAAGRAFEHKVISKDIKDACLLIKDWRNLIHPRAQTRLEISSESLRQKAKVAKAAMEAVVLVVEDSSDFVFFDGEVRVRHDKLSRESDEWISIDKDIPHEGNPTMKVEGKGRDKPNAVWIWSNRPIRRKRFFKAFVSPSGEDPPDELMFQFHQSSPKEGSDDEWYRVYWGRNTLFNRKNSAKYSRFRMGDIPKTREWTKLSVDFKRDGVLDLDRGIDGIAITLGRNPEAKSRAIRLGKSLFSSTR